MDRGSEAGWSHLCAEERGGNGGQWAPCENVSWWLLVCVTTQGMKNNNKGIMLINHSNFVFIKKKVNHKQNSWNELICHDSKSIWGRRRHRFNALCCTSAEFSPKPFFWFCFAIYEQPEGAWRQTSVQPFSRHSPVSTLFWLVCAFCWSHEQLLSVWSHITKILKIKTLPSDT